MAKVLLLGADGMLGRDVESELVARGHQVSSPLLDRFDLVDPRSYRLLQQREWGELDWIVNCAAYTAVDKAETEIMLAEKVNAVGPGLLAAVCAGTPTRLLHISTDYVFDGEASAPIPEDATPRPLGVYGASKLHGEENALREDPRSLIVRTAWLYGPYGKCFPRTILDAWRAGKALRVVDDQWGCPTYTADLARVLADLIGLPEAPSGRLHAVGPEAMTWHGLASHVVEAAGGTPEIEPVPTEAWPTPAKRPKYSVLDTTKLLALGLTPMRPVPEALADFLARHG